MRSLLEPALVAATAVANLSVGNPRLKPLVIGLSVLFWAGYLGFRWRADPAEPRSWGLSRAGARAAARESLLVLLAGAVALAAIGVARGTLVLDAAMLPLALVYPAWALVQQLLLQAMVVRHLLGVLRPAPAAVAGGALFGLAHWPDAGLMGTCALLGVATTAIWIRHRNLWPLAPCHGWLGILYYHWALGRAPWREVFG